MKFSGVEKRSCKNPNFKVVLYDWCIVLITSKTPAGRHATEDRSRNALWNAPMRVFSGWSICASPQTLIPSPIDSARRVTSIPRVSVSNSQPTPTILIAFQGAPAGRSVVELKLS